MIRYLLEEETKRNLKQEREQHSKSQERCIATQSKHTMNRLGKGQILERPDGEVYLLETEVLERLFDLEFTIDAYRDQEDD